MVVRQHRARRGKLLRLHFIRRTTFGGYDLSFEIGRPMDPFRAGADYDDVASQAVVWITERHVLLTFFRCADGRDPQLDLLVTDEVKNLFKRQVIELCLCIHFLCDCLHEVHIEADDVTVFIFIFEGGIRGLHSDTELFLRCRCAVPCFPTTSGGKENSTGCQNESG